MSIISLLSFKGSPGVTTTAVGLGATWSATANPLLVEADTAGGDVGPRFGMNPSPGIASLAAAARRAAAVSVDEHVQTLPGGLSVLFAPVSADHARAAVGLIAPSFERIFRDSPDDVLVDCGRVDSSSPSLEIVERSDLAVVCVRSDLAGLSHAIPGAAALRERTTTLVALVIGDGSYVDAEISDALGVPVIGHLPSDPQGAGFLAGAPGTERALSRSVLIRACHSLIVPLVALAKAETAVAS